MKESRYKTIPSLHHLTNLVPARDHLQLDSACTVAVMQLPEKCQRNELPRNCPIGHRFQNTLSPPHVGFPTHVDLCRRWSKTGHKSPLVDVNCTVLCWPSLAIISWAFIKNTIATWGNLYPTRNWDQHRPSVPPQYAAQWPVRHPGRRWWRW